MNFTSDFSHVCTDFSFGYQPVSVVFVQIRAAVQRVVLIVLAICPSTRGSCSLQKVNWLKVSLQGKSHELLRFRSGKTWSTTSPRRTYLHR